MFRNKPIEAALIDAVNDAERATVEAYNAGRIEHEPSITDRFLGHLEYAIAGIYLRKIDVPTLDGRSLVFRAKTLTSTVRNGQENLHGADFLAVFHLDLPGYRVSKGFLVQSKRLKEGQKLSGRDLDRLKTQCRTMLDRSPVAYVWLYSSKGIRVVSAIDVLAADITPLDIYKLTTWPLSQFFKAHFGCLVGDFRITASTPEELDLLLRSVEARSGVVISGTCSVDGEELPQLRMPRK
jgi:hypothetical protein